MKRTVKGKPRGTPFPKTGCDRPILVAGRISNDAKVILDAIRPSNLSTGQRLEKVILAFISPIQPVLFPKIPDLPSNVVNLEGQNDFDII